MKKVCVWFVGWWCVWRLLLADTESSGTGSNRYGDRNGYRHQRSGGCRRGGQRQVGGTRGRIFRDDQRRGSLSRSSAADRQLRSESRKVGVRVGGVSGVYALVEPSRANRRDHEGWTGQRDRGGHRRRADAEDRKHAGRYHHRRCDQRRASTGDPQLRRIDAVVARIGASGSELV